MSSGRARDAISPVRTSHGITGCVHTQTNLHGDERARNSIPKRQGSSRKTEASINSFWKGRHTDNAFDIIWSLNKVCRIDIFKRFPNEIQILFAMNQNTSAFRIRQKLRPDLFSESPALIPPVENSSR